MSKKRLQEESTIVRNDEFDYSLFDRYSLSEIIRYYNRYKVEREIKSIEETAKVYDLIYQNIQKEISNELSDVEKVIEETDVYREDDRDRSSSDLE